MIGYKYLLRQTWRDLSSLSNLGFVVRAVLCSMVVVYAFVGLGVWFLVGLWNSEYQFFLTSKAFIVVYGLFALLFFWPLLSIIVALLVQEELIARVVSMHYGASRRVSWARSLVHGFRILVFMVLSYVLLSPLIVLLFVLSFFWAVAIYLIGSYWLARGLFELALIHNVPMSELKLARRGHFKMFLGLGSLFQLLMSLSFVLAPFVTVAIAVFMTHYAYTADPLKKRDDEDLAELPPVGGGNIQG